MHLFYYLRGAIGDKKLINEHASAVKELLSGTFNSSDLEKLKGHDVYSFRLNQEARLLFCLVNVAGEDCLMVLEHLPNHKYHASRFLRSGVLRRFLDKIAVVGFAVDFEFVTADKDEFNARVADISSAERAESAAVLDYFQNKVIHLSHEQAGALCVKLPAAIKGGAGSGKTAVAVSIISASIESSEIVFAEDRRKILYVATSQALVESVKGAWLQLPQAVECPHEISFKSYAELIKEQRDAAECPLVGEAEFRVWYADFCGKERAVAKSKKQVYAEPLDPALAYQEFRICAAYSKEQYLLLGGRQSLVGKDQRAVIYKAYELYQLYLNPNPQDRRIDPSFYHFDIREIGAWDMVLMDEGQDLGLGQLMEVARFARERQFVVCMDDNQRLNDELSVFVRACDLLGIRAENRISLHTSFRCPPQIMAIAKKVQEFRDFLAQGTLDKHLDTEEVHTRASKLGRSYLLSDDDLASLPWLREAAKGTDFVVITSPACVEEARKRFNTPLVFTPETIKGLEYRIVIAWRLYSPEIFSDASLRLKELVGAKQPIHQAKKGFGTSQFNPHLHSIYTAYTRATELLLISEPATRENASLLERIHPLTEKGLPEQSMVQFSEASREQWLLEVNKLLDVGQEAMAFEIFSAQALGDASAFAALIAARRPAASPDLPEEVLKQPARLGGASVHLREEKRRIEAPPRKAGALVAKKAAKEVAVPELTREQVQAQKLCSDFNLQKLLVSLTVMDAENLMLAGVNVQDKSTTLYQFIFNDPTRRTEFFKFTSNELGMVVRVPFKVIAGKLGDKDQSHALLLDLHRLQSKFIAMSKAHAIMGIIPFYVASILRYTDPGKALTQILLNVSQMESYKKKMVTPIMIATLSKNQSAIKLLTKMGANLEAFTADGRTSAYYAVLSGDCQILEQLKKLGARLDSPLKSGHTLAGEVAQRGHTDMLRCLKKWGVDLEATDSNGESPAGIATKAGKFKVLETLQQLGVNINARDKTERGYSPVHIAIVLGHNDLLKELGRLKADFNLTAGNGQTPASIAAEYGNCEVLSILYDLGTNLAANESDEQGASPATIAAQNGNIEILRLLHSLDINLGSPDPDGATPAYLAAQHDRVDVLRFLAEVGLKLDIPDAEGITPAYIAAEKGHLSSLQVLKELGANLDLPSKTGATPLFIAVQLGHSDMVRFLIAAGCTVNAVCELSEEELTAYANQCCTTEEQEKMAAHIRRYLAKPAADATHIPLSLVDIAAIMGNDECRAVVLAALSRKQNQRLIRSSFFQETSTPECNQSGSHTKGFVH